MAQTHGAIEKFCAVKDVPTIFENALGEYTPCFFDTVISSVFHFVGIFFLGMQLFKLRRGRGARYRLLRSTRIYQWFACAASVICLVTSVFEFSKRTSGKRTLISPQGTIAPYECLNYSAKVAFWCSASLLFYTELERFSWDGLMAVRFSICVVSSTLLTKLAVAIHVDEIRHSGSSILLWASVCCHAFLALFGVTQIPAARNVVARQTQNYEMCLMDKEDGKNLKIALRAIVCPERKANLLSRLSFSWIFPLVQQGYKRPVEVEDIWLLDDPDRVTTLLQKFRTNWNPLLSEKGELQRVHRSQSRLLKALWKTVGHLLLKALPFAFIVDVAHFSGPVSLDLLVRSVETEKPFWKSFLLAVFMFSSMFVVMISSNQQRLLSVRAGFQLRSILTAEVHRKVLLLTPTERSRFSSGHVFNLVATDAEALQTVCYELITGLISGPIRIALAVALLYKQLGVSAFVAVGTLLILIPIQPIVAHWSGSFVSRALEKSDDRAKREQEIVSGIETVKLNTWEAPLEKRVLGIRKEELMLLWKYVVLSTTNVVLALCMPAIVSISAFTAYTLLGNELTAANAFVSLALFGILQQPLYNIPDVVRYMVRAHASLKRVATFLSCEERIDSSPLPAAREGQIAIEINGDFSWDIQKPPCLHDVEVCVPAGSLTAVVGATGSGKTSILSTLVGLMEQVSGSATVIRGSVALVPQTPFVFLATVKQNILFGLDYDEARYKAAIQASCLGPDLEMFPAGDETELGERGINVSGGQKQRIALARAVYSNADVCLLDDPLSALDAKVGQNVFQECIRGAMKDKTVLLATNQLQNLHEVDHIIFLSGGHVVEQGTYAELMRLPHGEFARMVNKKLSQVEPNGSNAEQTAESKQSSSALSPACADAPFCGDGALRGEEHKLVTKEERSFGMVSFEVLMEYISAMSGLKNFVWLVIQFLLSDLIRLAALLWLLFWSKESNDEKHGQMFYLWIYAGIASCQVAVTAVCQLDFKRMGYIASTVLHQNILTSILKAPMSFFHSTPVGRVMNRLTSDLAYVDKDLVEHLSFFLRKALELTSTLIFIAVVTPLTIPFLMPIVMSFCFLYIYLQSTSREIKRLDSIARSPVLSSIGDALNGFSTVCAFSSEKWMISRHMEFIDDSIVLTLLGESVKRWVNLRLELLGTLCSFCAAVLAIEQRLDPGYAALVIFNSLNIVHLTLATIEAASVAENAFNAVERVAEFSNLETEGASKTPEPVKPSWPENGSVTFLNVKLRYREDLPYVLEGISTKVAPNQRIGVVGRTGAGKSSMVKALLRMVELSEGRVDIDGVDTSKMDLKRLRSQIACIPQAPYVFSDTVRSNLDPGDTHSSAELWAALDRAHLGDFMRRHDDGLDMELREGGAPLSFGQVQLLSLARSILRDTKIVILDEATANVDMEIDALIQETLRKEFEDKTVISIAHRLQTIIDADKVLVLEQGKVVEFDSPANLLADHESVFAGMVRETGKKSESRLRAIVRGKSV